MLAPITIRSVQAVVAGSVGELRSQPASCMVVLSYSREMSRFKVHDLFGVLYDVGWSAPNFVLFLRMDNVGHILIISSRHRVRLNPMISCAIELVLPRIVSLGSRG